MRRLFTISITLLLLTYSSNFAQNHQNTRKLQKLFCVRGKVVNAEGKPIIKTIVLIPEIKRSTETDPYGSFEFSQLPKGKYHLEFRKKGYMPYVSDTFEIKNKEIILRVVLKKELIEKVVVTATKTPKLLKNVPVRTELISEEEIEASGAKTVYEVLDKELIGVWVNQSCTNCNFSELRMQGLEGGYSQILIDGLPVFSGLASVYGLQQIRSEDIERIEVIKGACSALYGAQAIGGVVNIITREPTLDPEISFEGTYGSYNSQDFALRAAGRNGILGAVVTAQRGSNDYVDINDDNFTDKVESDNLNLSLKTNFYFAQDLHRITLLSRYIDEFRRGGYLPNIDDPLDENSEHIDTNRYEYGIGYQGIFKGTNILNLNIIATKHDRRATNASRPFDSNEDMHLFDSQYSHQILEGKHTITSGINYKDEKINEIINYYPAPEKRAKTISVYTQNEITFSEKLDFILGLRYDHIDSSLIEESSLSPRVGAKWDINQKFSLRASIGSGFRVPYLFAEDLHLCSAAPLIYNSGTLKPEKSLSYNISGEYVSSQYILDFNIFRTDIKKKIYFSEEDAPSGFDFIYLNGGDAYTQGFETNASIPLHHSLRLILGFAYTDAKYEEAQDYSIGTSKYIMRTPEVAGLLNLEYSNSKCGMKANFSGRFTGRMYIENYVEEKIERTPSYNLWDIKVTKNLGHFFISFGVDNVFNHVQRKIYNASEDESAAYIYAPLTGRYIYAAAGVNY